MHQYHALQLSKIMMQMQHQDSHISLSRNFLTTSMKQPHSKSPGGCASYRVQQSITCLQFCTQSGSHRTVRFHPAERIHRLDSMGGILHMAVHPSRSCGNKGPGPIPPYFCGTGTHRSPRRRGKPHLEVKHGEKYRNLLSIDSQLNQIDPSTNIIFLTNVEQGYRTKLEILLEGVFQYII